MATRSVSRHRSIPINVKVERRSPPVRQLQPKAGQSPAEGAQPRIVPTRSAATAWSEAHRRRIMWISVGAGMLVILIGWVALFSAQIRGNSPTFFGDAARMVRDIKWPWEPAPVPASEQEIRQLEEQVFPQFQ